jgi:hypothetical protein
MSTRRLYTLRTRQLGANAYNELQKCGKTVLKKVKIDSVQDILKILDVKNESTLRAWAKVGDWSKSALKERLQQRGKKAILTDEQQKEVVE